MTTIDKKSFVFRYRTHDHFIDFFRTYYGPVHKAFLALDETGQAALERDLRETIARCDTATDGSMRVPAEYAEVVIVKS